MLDTVQTLHSERKSLLLLMCLPWLLLFPSPLVFLMVLFLASLLFCSYPVSSMPMIPDLPDIFISAQFHICHCLSGFLSWMSLPPLSFGIAKAQDHPQALPSPPWQKMHCLSHLLSSQLWYHSCLLSLLTSSFRSFGKVYQLFFCNTVKMFPFLLIPTTKALLHNLVIKT